MWGVDTPAGQGEESVSFCFSMQYIRNSPVLGRLLLEKGKYEYKQIVCGYSYYVISC